MTEERATRRVTLKAPSVNPFDDWEDWYGTNSEAIVTFQTMQYALWQQWDSDCISIVHSEDCDHEDLQEEINCNKKKRVITPENFNAHELPAPGVHRSETNYDDNDVVDEIYKIYVPRAYMTEKICRKWIERLNEGYNRNFHLKLTEEQKNAPIKGNPATKFIAGSEDKDDPDSTAEE